MPPSPTSTFPGPGPIIPTLVLLTLALADLALLAPLLPPSLRFNRSSKHPPHVSSATEVRLGPAAWLIAFLLLMAALESLAPLVALWIPRGEDVALWLFVAGAGVRFGGVRAAVMVYLAFDWPHRLDGGPTRRILSRDALLARLGGLLTCATLLLGVWEFIVVRRAPWRTRVEFDGGLPFPVLDGDDDVDGDWTGWQTSLGVGFLAAAGCCMIARKRWGVLLALQGIFVVAWLAGRILVDDTDVGVGALYVDGLLSVIISVSLVVTEEFVRGNNTKRTMANPPAHEALLGDDTIVWYGAVEIFDEDGRLQGSTVNTPESSIC
ncbi:hypothetical protein HK101_002031 [Irineochytrium annulatum]|nr:hypothetical protein HK101_002031 [Irineochytrium annulatum]